MTKFAMTVAALFACAGFVLGAEPTLKVGDAAPKLQASKWLKGEPIKELEKGKIYIMEFWATWCGPCRAAMPHVTQLQAKYKDKGVMVIGMNVWENDAKAVEPFVQKMGEKMGYSVAMDVVEKGSRGAMAETWLAAAGQNGIPCSFIVDREGKIAWIGHPMMMDRPLGLIVEGKFDPAKEAEVAKKLDELQKQYADAMRGKEYDKAIATLDQLGALDPSFSSACDSARMVVMYRKGDYAAGNKLAAKLAEGEASTDQIAAIQLVYTMLSAGDAEKIDADLAIKVAQKAVSLGEDEQIPAKLMLARAYAAKKQYDKAAEVQAQIVEKVTGEEKAAAQKALDEYKQKAGQK